jgi:predicted transcriptional regulator of viral defense system
VFTPSEFARLFGVDRDRAKYFLEKESQDGLLVRLKKGLYSLKTDLPSEQEIANRLYAPSYISFEYALAFYNLLPEMVYAVTSATTKPTRVFTVADKAFTFTTIKPKAYTGYYLNKQAGRGFFIAEPEKALVDYWYLVTLGKRPVNDRLSLANLDKDKLKIYARLFGRERLMRLVCEQT